MNRFKHISFFLLLTLFSLQVCICNAQYISLNGAYVSIGSGTVVRTDTLANNNTSTVANAGTITLYTINNAGTVQGNGLYNIAQAFTNSGTFSSGTSTVHYNGSGAQSIPALTFYNFTASGSGTIKTATGTLAVNGTITTNSNVVLNMSTYDLGGTLGTITNNGTIKTQSISATPFSTGKTWTGAVEYNNSTGGQTVVAGTYTDLINNNTSGTNIAAAALTVNGGLTLNASSTFDMATYALSGSLTSISGTGVLKTQNTSTTPIPAGKTWTGLVNYNSSSAQTIVYGNYSDLTASGGNRTIDSNGTLGIAGTFTPGGGTYTVTATTVNFNGSSAQTIPAFNFENLTVSGGNTKSCGGNLNLRNTLLLAANTTLSLGSNNIRLQSDSTYTGRIATVPSTASITYSTGRFITERYVKGRRKYRLITSPVTTSPNATLSGGEESLSIWGNWQNQGNTTTPNVGTFITGGSSGDGFDTQTPNASLFTYDSPGRIFTGFTTANGKNTKYTPLKAGVPYYMFVFGDRTNSTITSNPNKTVLSATGKVLTGDQTYNTSSSIPLSNTVGGYTMIGNPFASPIDWASVSRTNLSNTYWGWDPNLSSTGGYVTVSTTGTVTLISPFSGSVGLDQYIQSGQGFFVKTTAASPVLTIHEADKVANFNPIAFRTGANNLPLLAMNLFYDDVTGSTLMDGTLAAFDPSFSNQVGNEDASKIIKTGEGLGLQLQSELLSINARKMPVNGDTLFLNTASLTKPQYRLQIFAKQMDSSALEAYLEDTYLNTSRLLSLVDTNNVTFSINSSAPSSFKVNRFRIVFRQSGDLSGIITSIRAVKENAAVKVSWDVSSEQEVRKYELQRADSGNGFTAIGEVLASGMPTYQWLDNNPASGINQYRVRVVKTDGSAFFSRVVTVDMVKEKPAVKIFPNPVQNRQLHIQLMNIEKGIYSARLFNAKGQLIMEQKIDHSGGSANLPVTIGKQVAPGMYFFQLVNSKTKYNQTIIIE